MNFDTYIKNNTNNIILQKLRQYISEHQYANAQKLIKSIVRSMRCQLIVLLLNNILRERRTQAKVLLHFLSTASIEMIKCVSDHIDYPFRTLEERNVLWTTVFYRNSLDLIKYLHEQRETPISFEETSLRIYIRNQRPMNQILKYIINSSSEQMISNISRLIIQEDHLPLYKYILSTQTSRRIKEYAIDLFSIKDMIEYNAKRILSYFLSDEMSRYYSLVPRPMFVTPSFDIIDMGFATGSTNIINIKIDLFVKVCEYSNQSIQRIVFTYLHRKYLPFYYDNSEDTSEIEIINKHISFIMKIGSPVVAELYRKIILEPREYTWTSPTLIDVLDYAVTPDEGYFQQTTPSPNMVDYLLRQGVGVTNDIMKNISEYKKELKEEIQEKTEDNEGDDDEEIEIKLLRNQLRRLQQCKQKINQHYARQTIISILASQRKKLSSLPPSNKRTKWMEICRQVGKQNVETLRNIILERGIHDIPLFHDPKTKKSVNQATKRELCAYLEDQFRQMMGIDTPETIISCRNENDLYGEDFKDMNSSDYIMGPDEYCFSQDDIEGLVQTNGPDAPFKNPYTRGPPYDDPNFVRRLEKMKQRIERPTQRDPLDVLYDIPYFNFERFESLSTNQIISLTQELNRISGLNLSTSGYNGLSPSRARRRFAEIVVNASGNNFQQVGFIINGILSGSLGNLNRPQPRHRNPTAFGFDIDRIDHLINSEHDNFML